MGGPSGLARWSGPVVWPSGLAQWYGPVGGRAQWSGVEASDASDRPGGGEPNPATINVAHEEFPGFGSMRTGSTDADAGVASPT
jgi:hypothetical protein